MIKLFHFYGSITSNRFQKIGKIPANIYFIAHPHRKNQRASRLELYHNQIYSAMKIILYCGQAFLFLNKIMADDGTITLLF